jgi:hypothetical protein
MISLLKLQRCAIVVAIVLVLVTAIVAPAQRTSYTWMELPRRDAERLLENSPWSQTQVDTDLSEQFYSPTRPGTSSVGQVNSKGSIGSQQSVNNSRADRGAVNAEVYVKYRISFLSARPVRQALAKVILSSEKAPNDQLASQLQAFVERDFSPYVVVAVTVKSNDQRWSGPVLQAISSATTDSLRNNAYLERQDGKRLFLTQYIAPISDGLGAKFIFPRLVEGEPFLKAGSGNVRFFAQFNDSFKLNMVYKVSDMIFDQKLEY